MYWSTDSSFFILLGSCSMLSMWELGTSFSPLVFPLFSPFCSLEILLKYMLEFLTLSSMAPNCFQVSKKVCLFVLYFRWTFHHPFLLSPVSNLLFNFYVLCFQWSYFSFSRLSLSCHIKLLYFISAQNFQFHNFLFSKDVPLSVISLIIQNIHILKFWNIYINSWFCWWSFLALDFGIHQSFEWKDSLWQKNGNICLSFFSKVG